jgi:2-polyprenyl-3-methyl-5-hydroxy-6-metoxy-1,4-benzoquinol methylase
MRAKFKRLIKNLAWKALRLKHPLILGPNSQVVGRFGEYLIVATEGNSQKRYLPISYTYHTPKQWRLHYDVRGNESGTLRYSLSAPNEPPFCETAFDVQLPFEWTVELDDCGLTGNGERLPPLLGRSVPLRTPWLVGEFEFRSKAGGVLRRKTGHRVKLGVGGDGEQYFQWVYGNYDEESNHYPREILGVIGKHRKLKGRLLDVGCATGLVVAYALAQGLEADGIDNSAEAVAKAFARTGGRCRVLDFDSADVSDFSGNYDIIVLHSVLEHLGNPQRALQLLFELCRPGGVIYIQTLNADSLMHLIMGDDWGGYTDHTHKSPWLTADWIGETASSVGFEVAELRRYYVWNDNVHDQCWQAFSTMIQLHPADVVLEDRFGDAVEVVLRRPDNLDAAAEGNVS